MELLNRNERTRPTYDVERLLNLLKIPEIEEAIFRQVEVFAEVYRNKIQDFHRNSQAGTWRDERNLIRLCRDEYLKLSEDERIRTYISYLINNDEFREVTLKDFYGIIKPFLD